MRFILIRHGEKAALDRVEDEDLPLTDDGERQVRDLARTLRLLDVLPDLYLTSQYKHAVDTATLLASELRPPAMPEAESVAVAALTPGTRASTFDEILEEIGQVGIPIGKFSNIALVGHEPRLNQFVTRMTRIRGRPLEQAEAVCLKDGDLRDYIRGSASLDFRSTFGDDPEQDLRPKVQAKMTTATLLAGFTFTVLIQLLLGQDLSTYRVAASIFLIIALGLFIACVYIYDRLAMPEGFWVYGERPASRRPTSTVARKVMASPPRLGAWFRDLTSDRARANKDPFAFDEAFQYGGALYAYMVWTWRFVFGPAVLFAFAGFALLIVETKDVILVVPALAAITSTFIYYLIVRPLLGAD